jgi:hypothetical protein
MIPTKLLTVVRSTSQTWCSRFATTVVLRGLTFFAITAGFRGLLFLKRRTSDSGPRAS